MDRVYSSMLLFLGLLLAGCAGQIPLIGFDKDANVISKRVSEDKYIEHLSTGLISIQDSVLPALENQNEGKQWKLRTAVLGFGVNVTAGIGPFKVGLKPRIRAAFSNGENPPIP